MSDSGETSVFTGGCLCGAIRYRALGPPRWVNHCHCRMCGKASGAPFVTWATFAREAVTFTAGAPSYFRSSAIAERGFCAQCGSAMIWRSTRDPETIDLTAGTLDDPSALAPRDHIWVENAPPWLHLADALPRYPRGRDGA